MNRAPLSILLLLALLLALLWLAPDVPLLGFGAVLLAIAFHAAARPLMRHAGMNEPTAVLVVVVTLVLLLAFGVWMGAGPLATQVAQLAEELPRSLSEARETVAAQPWGPAVLNQVDPQQALDRMQGQAVSAATGTLGVLSNTVLVPLLAVYLAVSPGTYRNGLVALLGPNTRSEAQDALQEMGHVLRGWLLGQGFAMTVTGLAIWAGLWLIGMPLALPLALIAAVLGFIPVLGPVLAAIPAVLLALSQDPWLALWVAGVFLVVQFIEGNILTPLVQSSAADLAPALLLLAQLLMGVLFGLIGVALAAPGLVVAMVLVRRGYIKGWLEQR
ncbi:AI-2E family transporter [Falsiroseomonas selenitidurans]|uniref:AI-2E family transporter n=1 Tax=Falsiroseomonas selenitidurans TaxID=2716335 RepID=A0ABX1E971_9PROT|nr:AI-2E family transporter [Falsiroseomonas selenitidurans]NKC33744.1 AI-2E family transporter [Falsiroseomonas selenitidurans]